MATPVLPSLLAALAAKASPESDAELLSRYATHRDDAAFAGLVRRYARLVWRVARTRCRSDATAEDVFQAAFVILARKAGSIRSGGALPGWLHRTAHRLAVKATRSERPAAPLTADRSVSADPLDALSARELLAAVDDEMARLSDAERSVLVLCGVENQSLDEAAARLGWKPGSVKGRLERARAKLRARLDARGLALPAVVLALVGGPPAKAVQAAMAVPGGAVPPAVEQLIAEGLGMKGTITKAVCAVALVGAVLTLGGGSGGPTPPVTAAPVPKEIKRDHTAWGEELGGLQAGLRMPSGTTLWKGEVAELQVVVRNVSEQPVEVTYTQEQDGVFVHGKSDGGVIELFGAAIINGLLPAPRVHRLEPAAELVRWTIRVRHTVGDDKTPPGSRVDLAAGKYQFVMKRVSGDLLGLASNVQTPTLDRLGTGTLEVNLSDDTSPFLAPVPKEKGKLAAWSEPVKADWQASGVTRLGVAWAADGKSVLVPAQNEKGGGIDVRDADSGKVTKTLAFAGAKEDRSFLPTSIAVTADGKTVYAGGSVFSPGKKAEAPRGVVTWRDADKDDAPTVTTDTAPVDAPVVLSPDNKQLATLGPNGAVEARDTATGKLFWSSQLGGKRGRPAALAFQAKEGAILVGTDAGQWIGYDAKTGKTLMAITNLGVSVRAAAASADGKVEAFGGKALDGGQALVLIGKDAPTVTDAVPEKEAINGLAFSPDNKHIAAACSDGVVRVFEVEKGKLVASAKEHTEAVFGVAYSPDGSKLLTVGKDAIKVWDVETLMKAK